MDIIHVYIYRRVNFPYYLYAFQLQTDDVQKYFNNRVSNVFSLVNLYLHHIRYRYETKSYKLPLYDIGFQYPELKATLD